MMRVPKFMGLVCTVTLFSLLYVYQQTEIFRSAYEGQRRSVAFQELSDKNTLLRYNVKKNTSLTRIYANVPRTADFQIPDTYCLLRVTGRGAGVRLAGEMPRRESLFSRIFSLKRQAEAKTVDNP